MKKLFFLACSLLATLTISAKEIDIDNNNDIIKIESNSDLKSFETSLNRKEFNTNDDFKYWCSYSITKTTTYPDGRVETETRYYTYGWTEGQAGCEYIASTHTFLLNSGAGNW